MIDNKKEQERDELHRAIWAIADELRGAVDGWDFKNYVLGTMFYRYISENLANYINQGEIEAGYADFDYAKLSDEDAESAREDMVKTKGFFILPSELFCNVLVRASKDDNLNETLESVFRHIEESAKGTESEGSFAGLFDDYDVNSNKLGATVAKRNDKLVKLLQGVANMNLGDVKNHDIDAFGDAYEYLMTMYASNAGKSGGEFFTPADVSELLTRLGTVGKTEINKVYDPACGSGSLLLKAEKVLGKDAVRNGFFGQEINITTYNLCRINMHLHDIGFDKFDIACEDTLTTPMHWDDEPFELIVSNPPYSIKWEGDDNPLLITDPRFSPAGVLAPKSKADLAFIMHSLSWLASNGTAAIVCFPGIMYRGGAEQKIRKYLIDNNFVDCVIQLPSNLFFGTSIATCIMVLKKGKADNKVLFIDATKECIKVTNNNKLTPDNIDRIVNTYAEHSENAHFSHLADYSEIVENDYNLSVSTYVEAEDTREVIDIEKLNAEIAEIVAREQVLRDEIDRIIAEIEDQLLSFERNIKRVTLAEAFHIRNGYTPSKKVPEYWINGDIPWFRLEDIRTNGRILNDAIQHVSKEGIKKSGLFKKNSIMISTTATLGEHAIVKTDYLSNQQITNLTIKESYQDKLLPKFVFYYGYILGKQCFDVANYSGGIPIVDQNKFGKLEIPIPPIEEQQRIVTILDRFDTICNDVLSGLPAEIQARQKQYEYYRDKLLNFKEMSV